MPKENTIEEKIRDLENQSIVWSCNFNTSEHEIGCPHKKWKKEELLYALVIKKKFESLEFHRKFLIPMYEDESLGANYKEVKKFITDNFTPNSKLEKAILNEMMIARHEGQPTSRLTSLYNTLINKKS